MKSVSEMYKTMVDRVREVDTLSHRIAIELKTDPELECCGRELALARTKLDEASMWLTRAESEYRASHTVFDRKDGDGVC